MKVTVFLVLGKTPYIIARINVHSMVLRITIANNRLISPAEKPVCNPTWFLRRDW